VRNQYFPNGQFPASTAVGVTGLFMPEILLEVEAVALLKD
jgi:enamine deaminase RidA (YjgF/YER057c/UK114 family)